MFTGSDQIPKREKECKTQEAVGSGRGNWLNPFYRILYPILLANLVEIQHPGHDVDASTAFLGGRNHGHRALSYVQNPPTLLVPSLTSPSSALGVNFGMKYMYDRPHMRSRNG